MFSHVRGVYGSLGVMLFLVAMYLVLEHGTDASNIIKAGGGTLSDVFKTLQGR